MNWELFVQIIVAVIAALSQFGAAYYTVHAARRNTVTPAEAETHSSSIILPGHLKGLRNVAESAGNQSTRADWKPWRAFTMILVGCAIAGALAMPLAFLLATSPAFSLPLAGMVAWGLGGAYIGAMIWMGFWVAEFNTARSNLVLLSMGWAAGGAIGGLVSYYQPGILFGFLGGAIGGTIGGIAIWWSVNENQNARPVSGLVKIAASWACGMAISSSVTWSYYGYFSISTYIFMGIIFGCISALLGGGVTVAEVGRMHSNSALPERVKT